MEEVDFVRKCIKANSTEVTLVAAGPNPAYWRFAAELQLSDIKACAFDERVEIVHDNAVVGYLTVAIRVVEEAIKFNKRRYNRYIEVKAETEKTCDKLEMTQEIVSHLTTDLQLIRETKVEHSAQFDKTIETVYQTDVGYEMTRTTNLMDQKNQLLFTSTAPRVLMSDGTVFMLQRLMPKIGVYEIELPYCDIDAKIVSLSSLSSIGHKTMEFGTETADLVGIKRVHYLIHGPNMYHMWLFEDGHIAQRESELGQIRLKVSSKPTLVKDQEDQLPIIEPKPLDWRRDIQLKSIYRQKAIDLSNSNSKYLEDNSEVLKLVRDFYNSVLSEKPDDIYNYASDFFTTYGSN